MREKLEKDWMKVGKFLFWALVTALCCCLTWCGNRFRTRLSKSVTALFIFPLYSGLFRLASFAAQMRNCKKLKKKKIDRSPNIDRSLSFFAFNNFVDICLKQCYHLFRHKSEKRNAYAEKTALQMD